MNPRCQLQVASLSSDRSISGAVKSVTGYIHQLANPRWTAGGDALLYSTSDHLWRVGLGGEEPVRLEQAGTAAETPAISRRGHRAAFVHLTANVDVWAMDAQGNSRPLISSSLRDVSARFSPDGSRVAFVTQRGGDQWIAFDSQDAGTAARQIWAIESAGGAPRQLTALPKGAQAPAWSQDGLSVYFNANSTGRFEIYRMPVKGGAAEQVTKEGGYLGQESPDGQTLYYIKSSGESPLFAMPARGGPEKKVIDSVVGRGFQIFRDGIYYLGAGQGQLEVRFRSFAGGRNRVIGSVKARMISVYMSVSPDRKTALLSYSPQSGSDLMLIGKTTPDCPDRRVTGQLPKPLPGVAWAANANQLRFENSG
jgi:hypothetical protein